MAATMPLVAGSLPLQSRASGEKNPRRIAAAHPTPRCLRTFIIVASRDAWRKVPMNLKILLAASAAMAAALSVATPASAQDRCLLDTNANGVADAGDTTDGATATGAGSLACGQGATAGATQATVVGTQAAALATGGIAIGGNLDGGSFGALATDRAGVAVGGDSEARGVGAIAIGGDGDADGDGAVANGVDAIAIGDGALAQNTTGAGPTDDNIAIGSQARATGVHATSIGGDSSATGVGSTAIGWEADATANNTTALGNSAEATAPQATAIGRQTNATGTDSTALGQGASATMLNATALGQGAQAIHTNSVALGADTTTTAANQVNVGGRTIGGVANGVAATDAVNVSQLTATNTALANETANRMSADAALSSRVEGLSFDIRDTAREGRAGTASALAAAGLPQASGEGRTMIAGGIGTYRGKTAFAVGASHRLQGGNATFKVGLTYDSEKNVGANGGIGFEF